MLRKISTWFTYNHNLNDAHQGGMSQYQYCDYQGCHKEGIHKAPRVAQQAFSDYDCNQWYWFCLEHVREYNASWRFYHGMTEETAPQFGYQDPFQMVAHNQNGYNIQLTQEQLESLNILKLSYPYTADQLQSAYRTFVKRHHPDLKKTQDAEENIRAINNACQVLKSLLERGNKC